MTLENLTKFKNNQLIIELPNRFNSKKVCVSIEDFDDSRDGRIKKLRKPSNDPRFLGDIKAATTDFENSDNQ